MASLAIKNFKFGLDARREEIAAGAGTLVTLENCHINQGGEIEKRKSFVLQTGTLAFGLEAVSSGLWTFGSADVPGGLPGDVNYMQLKHPAVLEDAGAYFTEHHDMDRVLTTVFNDKIFAAARFTDGRWFLYYDGDLVLQSRNGIVLDFVDDAENLAQQLAAQIEAFGADAGWSATVDANSTLITTPLSVYGMTGTEEVLEETKTITITTEQEHVIPEPGASAFVKIQAAGSSDGALFSISAPNSVGASASLAISVAGQAIPEEFIALLVSAVNAQSSTTNDLDYTMVVDELDPTIATLLGPVGVTGLDIVNGCLINWDIVLAGFSLTTNVGLQASISPASMYEEFLWLDSYRVNGPAYCTVTQASGTVSYEWRRISGSPSVLIESSTSSQTKFYTSRQPAYTTLQAVFSCFVTDATTVTSPKRSGNNVTVTFKRYS